MRLLCLFITATFVFVFASCDNSDSGKTENLTGLYITCSMIKDSKVYSGWYHSGEYFLLEGSGETNGPVGSCAVIEGPDLYIAGNAYPDFTPGYWKNGKWFPLEGHKGTVMDITLDSDNVYGIFDSSDASYSWINNIADPLSPQTFTARAIVVFDNHPIIYGYNWTDTDRLPAYYSDGNLYQLGLPNDDLSSCDYAMVSSACVYDGDIYACGYIYNSETGYISGYWKNNEWVNVNCNYGIIGYKIEVNENGVYIAGKLEDGTPGCLYNGEWTSYENKVMNEDYIVTITSLLVKDSDIYIAVNYKNTIASDYYGGYYLNGNWEELEGDCNGEVCDKVSIEAILYQ